MPKLLFVREVPDFEKEGRRKTQVKLSAVAAVGLLTMGLIGASIALYAMHQPEPGRAVIDVAVAFFAWSTGRTAGEKAGIERR